MAANKSARRRAFVRAYVAGPPGVRGNGTKSAIAAGYSPAGAGSQAVRLLANAKIQSAVERALVKHDITADAVLAELGAIAFHDPRDFVTWSEHGVTLTPSDQLAHAAPIAEVGEYVSGGEHPTTSVRIKFRDKLDALEHLAKILGLLNGSNAGDPSRPVAVNIVLVGQDARPVSNGDGIQIHLGDGTGREA